MIVSLSAAFHDRLHLLSSFTTCFKNRTECVFLKRKQNNIIGKKSEENRVRKTGMLATFHNKGRHSLSPCCSLQVAASFAGASHNSQDVEEDVDDVSVKVEGSKNVLLWTQGQLLVAQEKLSVNRQKLQKTNKDGISKVFYTKDIHIP